MNRKYVFVFFILLIGTRQDFQFEHVLLNFYQFNFILSVKNKNVLNIFNHLKILFDVALNNQKNNCCLVNCIQNACVAKSAMPTLLSKVNQF